jgi:hypothetical protein
VTAVVAAAAGVAGSFGDVLSRRIADVGCWLARGAVRRTFAPAVGRGKPRRS